MARKRRTEPIVTADDGATLLYSEARSAWEGGEFSDWADEHGYPLDVGGQTIRHEAGVEDALREDQWDA